MDIIQGTPRLESLKRLLLVLIIFYIIGLIAKAVIKKATVIKAKPEAYEEQEINQEESMLDNNRQETAKDEKTGTNRNTKK